MPENSAIFIEDGPVLDLSEFDAAAFDLDGVITRTATVHAAAWKRLFDRFLECRAAAAGDPFGLSTSKATTAATWMASHGSMECAISSGHAASSCLTAGLMIRLSARRSAVLVTAIMGAVPRNSGQKGVEVFEGSVAFIRSVRNAGLKTAVVSASKNTVPILSAAGLSDLFDARIDGVEAARLGLSVRPTTLRVHSNRLLVVEMTA